MPELDIASQGDTVEFARKNLVEVLELFFESADATEIARRLHGEVFVTQIEGWLGKLRILSGREVCRILEAEGFSEEFSKARPAFAAAARLHNHC